MVAPREVAVACPPDKSSVWDQHPRVYLSFEQSDRVACPYCGQLFQRQS
ncbi:MAG: zinc-finger domain-containing protein [Gammaproteobacteria bacterium]|nr:zinc-finger domain-containing protein [Gammaproteobacteria bacterium]NVK87192.1 zinc-finger domain-containing protein [Gammaproteobacteria bacterium]